jgi:membrane protein implicated in regulation of membrane protease activity
MRWLKSIVREILGLFVDDGSLAIAILIWLALTVALLPRVAETRWWANLVLFAGLAVILIESVLRYARQRRK